MEVLIIILINNELEKGLGSNKLLKKRKIIRGEIRVTE